MENKMGVMPIPKLLVTMAAPMMVSMLILACYNVVDSYFVAKINEDALTALSLVFPLQNLMIAMNIGIAVGINAMIARSLGMGDPELVSRTAMQGLILTFCGYLIFLVVGFTAVRPFMESQTDVPRIIDYGADYLRICCVFAFGAFFQVNFERMIQASGRTLATMFTQGAGALLNMVLDPLFIFYFDMGVKGAAVATVVSQCAGCLFAMAVHFCMNRDVKLHLRYLKPDTRIMGKILYIGIPSAMMMSVGSVMVFLLNKILIGFSTTAVAVFGVYFKMQSFVLMPVMGMNNGMIPILGYNYGAGKLDRITDTLKLAFKLALCFMAMGVILFQSFPVWLLNMFEASPDMLAIGVPALRIICLHFPLAGICIPIGACFQALGRGMYSLYTSILRQLGALIPIAWVLSLFGNVDLVWFAFLGAEVVSLTVSIHFLKKTFLSVGACFTMKNGRTWPVLNK